MKRIMVLFIISVMILLSILPVYAAPSAGKVLSKAIYVVFDNSGSMYIKGNKAWSQAIYAMETFAAMLNFDNGDTMRIYTMHNVTTDGSTSGKGTNVIYVSGQSDIQKIHNMFTLNALATPYTPVKEAEKDLQNTSADEKWLLVISDGDFDSDTPEEGVQKAFKSIAENKGISVQYLALGEDVSTFQGSPSSDFYADKAQTSLDVINKLADICNRIFKRNSISDYKSGDKLVFDIPVSKIFVFAQGENINIESFNSLEGMQINEKSSYSVSYSTTGGAAKAKYPPPYQTDTSLKGTVITYENDQSIPAGTYFLNVSGASQIGVYYEPDVKFGAALCKNGEMLDSDDPIEAGDYTVKVGFLNRITGGFIEGSSLLGEALYVLTVNGKTYNLTGKNGKPSEQSINVSAGTVALDASVIYLEDYTDNCSVEYTITRRTSSMDMEIVSEKEIFELSEFENSTVVGKITVFIEGKRISDDVWREMSVPQISTSAAIDLTVEKGSETGTYIVKANYFDGQMSMTDTGTIHYDVSAEYTGTAEVCNCVSGTSFTINDDLCVLGITLDIPNDADIKTLEDSSNFIEITITHNDELLTEQQWNSMTIPTMETAKDIRWTVEKGSEVSTYIARPHYAEEGNIFTTATGDIPITVYAEGVFDNKAASGSLESIYRVRDSTSFSDKLLDFVKRNWRTLIIILIIITLVILYLTKKKLPKALNPRPQIVIYDDMNNEVRRSKGKYEKDFASVICPFGPQTGSVAFSSRGFSAAKAKIKAASKGTFYIMNYKAYAGNNNIEFGGSPIAANTTKPVLKSASLKTTIHANELRCECTWKKQ